MNCSKINTYYFSAHELYSRSSEPLKTSCSTAHWPSIYYSTTITANSSKPEISASKVAKYQELYAVKFQALEGCKLGISRYPDFEYNAKGGIGSGTISVKSNDDEYSKNNGELSVSFDVDKLYIPSLNSTTTKFLGLPLPPFLKIDIVPEVFEGTINKDNGQVDLKFISNFWFSIGSIYRAPPLTVNTTLTSEESQGKMRKGKGKRMNKDGDCILVGVALVNPIDDFFMNSFLGLPTECIALLKAKLIIT